MERDMSVQIVEVGLAEHRLWAEAVALFRGVRHDQHIRFLSDSATVAFVARDDDRVVGWAWGHRLLRADGDSMLLLYEIEVIGDERGKGIGRSLVEAFLELGRRERHQKMWLLTDEDNSAARSVYEATGGRRSNQHDISYWWPLA